MRACHFLGVLETPDKKGGRVGVPNRKQLRQGCQSVCFLDLSLAFHRGMGRDRDRGVDVCADMCPAEGDTRERVVEESENSALKLPEPKNSVSQQS